MNAIPSICQPPLITPLNDFVGFYSSKLAIKPAHMDFYQVAEPSGQYGQALQHVIVNNWRSMLEELVEAGYSITKVSDLTGISRRSVQRWFNGTEDMPAQHKLFAAVLALYCYYKYTGGCYE
ncbi:MAG: helix-turn-helix domain-containing protein [Gammaproteobacteria bacterium]